MPPLTARCRFSVSPRHREGAPLQLKELRTRYGKNSKARLRCCPGAGQKQALPPSQTVDRSHRPSLRPLDRAAPRRFRPDRQRLRVAVPVRLRTHAARPLQGPETREKQIL